MGSSPVFKANMRSSNSCDSSSVVTRLVLMKPPSVVYVPITGLGLYTLLGWLLGRSDARSQSADTWNTQICTYSYMSTCTYKHAWLKVVTELWLKLDLCFVFLYCTFFILLFYTGKETESSCYFMLLSISEMWGLALIAAL